MNRQNRRMKMRQDKKKQRQAEKSLARQAIENSLAEISTVLTRMQIVQEAILQTCFKKGLFTLEEFQQAAADFEEQISVAVKAEEEDKEESEEDKDEQG